MNPKAILTVMAVALLQILSPEVLAGPSGLHGQVRLDLPPGVFYQFKVVDGGLQAVTNSALQLPLRTSVRIYSAATGRLIAHFKSNANGDFSVVLRPGDYVLVPEMVHFGSYPIWGAYCLPFRVHVTARETTHQDVIYSSCQIPSAQPGLVLPLDDPNLTPMERQERQVPGSNRKPVSR